MGKVGSFVSDPKAGAYCQIVLDGGGKILVNHDKGGFKGGRLPISREIVLAHGRSLTARSAPAQGSCFRMTLPLAT
jgi:hypothetical protein